MICWSIKKSESEKIEVRILSAPYVDEGYDWVPVQIIVEAGGFSGAVSANFLGSEIIKLRDDLTVLNNNFAIPVIFQTIEGQLTLKVEANRSGHIKVVGELLDNAGSDNKLNFSFEIDQSYLALTIRQLDEVANTFNN